MIGSNELLARFLGLDLSEPTFASPQPLSDPSPGFEADFSNMDPQSIEDFDRWFEEVFSPVYQIPLD